LSSVFLEIVFYPASIECLFVCSANMELFSPPAAFVGDAKIPPFHSGGSAVATAFQTAVVNVRQATRLK
jgi:hypothetical protein